ncbi:MAG: hypothetical protein KDB07_12765, partial [Planctomycetes bacterium]|nr:hypothetical protein [Planctomycetota bacterium]
SSTGLTLEGGELISKLGGRFLLAAAVGRSVEGASRGLVNIRDRVAAGQDFGTAVGQAGLDTVRSISRGLASAVGIEGTARNLIQLIGGKSEEQASRMIEDVWDFFTLDATKEVIRKDREKAFRKQATDERNVKVESMRRELYANNNGWLRGMGVPMSQRHKDIEFTNWVNRRVEAEKARYDRIIQKGIEDEIYMG